MGQQGRSPEASGVMEPAPQELLSDVWSSSGQIETNSGGTLLTVSATFGGRAGAAEGVEGYFMNIIIKWS